MGENGVRNEILLVSQMVKTGGESVWCIGSYRSDQEPLPRKPDSFLLSETAVGARPSWCSVRSYD